MSGYVIRRILGTIPTLFIIVTICFFFIRLAPGGPFDREKAIPENILRNIEEKYNLDEPIVVQYARYVYSLLRGDLGPSFRYADRSVSEYLFRSLPNSMLLASLAMGIALMIGISSGVIAGYKRNTLYDYSFMLFAVFGVSVPSFVIGPLFMYFFSLQWGLLPTSGWLSGRAGVLTLVLPVISLALYYVATMARLSRASTIEVLQSDYIRTANAKGLSPSYILTKHVLKGALLPIASYFGPTFAAMLTGSVVIETIFRVPGIGVFFVQSAFNRDYTMIMGTVIIYSTVLIVMNLLVDIIYGILDPRISYS